MVKSWISSIGLDLSIWFYKTVVFLCLFCAVPLVMGRWNCEIKSSRTDSRNWLSEGNQFSDCAVRL